jgi:predicted ribosome quality control (RQC) complex YloA/Tae2 family protein
VPDKDTTPVAAAEALYKKARKLRRATDALAPLLEAAQGEVEYLEQLESDVAQLAAFEGMADLRALREVQVSSARVEV